MHANDILDLPNLQVYIGRFEAKRIRRGEDECWPWTAATMGRGYGKMNIEGTLFGAHVLSHLFAKGPIPNFGRGVGKNLCRHTCDNPWCTNHNHIIPGLQKQNIQDAFERHRMKLGMDRIDTVLTDDQVRAIRADPRLHHEIAEDYPVQRRQISRIKQGVRRRHV